MQMLETNNADLSIRAQAELLSIPRSSFYYKPIINDESEIANLIHEHYLSSDCRYGYRKITASLNIAGNIINHKKVLRIMQDMNMQGLYPPRFVNTSKQDANNRIYPYLLENLAIAYCNQVWATDITYIRIGGRFMYFIAIIDLHSRYIVAYELSHNLEVGFCLMALKSALMLATPVIFNTDQVSQFTCAEFINELNKYGIQISMDHKGRCFDNIFVERLWRTIKQEAIYFYRPETIQELEKCLSDFVLWYNNKRLHQSLNYRTPSSVYFNNNSKEIYNLLNE